MRRRPLRANFAALVERRTAPWLGTDTIFFVFVYSFLCLYLPLEISLVWALYLPHPERFLIGRPRSDDAGVLEALAFESGLFGDLLLGDDLPGASDGYLDLVAKTKAFMKRMTAGHDAASSPSSTTIPTTPTNTTSTFPSSRGAKLRGRLAESSVNVESGPLPQGWRWLLMLDDDVYLRPRALVEALIGSAPSQRFYAGQVDRWTGG